MNLGKRRVRNPTLITELMSKMRDGPVQSIESFSNQGFKEREVVIEQESSSDDKSNSDPRTATQLCNNDSIAQCSQDTYEDPSPSTQSQPQPPKQRTPLTIQDLARVHEVFAAKEKAFKEKQQMKNNLM